MSAGIDFLEKRIIVACCGQELWLCECEYEDDDQASAPDSLQIKDQSLTRPEWKTTADFITENGGDDDDV